MPPPYTTLLKQTTIYDRITHSLFCKEELIMEMFVDKVRITVCGGRGGDGAVAFHREKYVAAGGPDGGDGGHGGSVILHVNDNMTTLLDFRYKRKYAAQAGANGQGRNMSGKRGENLIIQ